MQARGEGGGARSLRAQSSTRVTESGVCRFHASEQPGNWGLVLALGSASVTFALSSASASGREARFAGPWRAERG